MGITITKHTSHSIQSLEALRKLIEQYKSWGLSLVEFQCNASVIVNGNTTTNVTNTFHGNGLDFASAYDLLQHIHRHYTPRLG